MKLVCLPGLDGTGAFFDDFVRALPASVQAQVVSYPRDQVLDGAALEARVEAVLPREPFVLLGESFSGPLALRVAAKAPAQLRGVVLVATFHRRPIPAWLEQLRPLLGAPLFSLPLPRVVIRRVLAGVDAPEALVERLRAEVGSVRGEVLAARAKEAATLEVSDAARRCPVPALYLAGAHDALLRREVVEELRALMPRLEVEVLAAPHLVLQRAPVEAAAAVGAFLARLG